MTTKNEEAKQWMTERIKARQEKKKAIPFSVTQYQDMKEDGMSDAKIVAKYNTNVAILNAWKKEHNLIGKHNLKTIQKEQGEAVEVKLTTNQPEEDKPVSVDYKALCEFQEKEIDKSKAYIKRQLADNQKLAEENERLHKKLQEPAFPSLEEELSKWKSDHALMSMQYQGAKSDCAKLDDHLQEVKSYQDETNAELILLKNQLTNANDRITQLKQIESDYMQLERDYLNEKSEKERMARMLDRLKNTEQINVWLMEQHVAFHAQLDEVTA